MAVTLSCPKCNKKINFDLSVFKLDGPTIYIDCHFCKKKYSRNFVRYLFKQAKCSYGTAGYKDATTLISLAREIEKRFK